MKSFTVAELSYDPIGEMRRECIEKMKANAPHFEAMAELHIQNATLAKQRAPLEPELLKQKTLADVKAVEKRMASNRSVIQANNRTILDHLYAILNRR